MAEALDLKGQSREYRKWRFFEGGDESITVVEAGGGGGVSGQLRLISPEGRFYILNYSGAGMGVGLQTPLKKIKLAARISKETIRFIIKHLGAIILRYIKRASKYYDNTSDGFEGVAVLRRTVDDIRQPNVFHGDDNEGGGVHRGAIYAGRGSSLWDLKPTDFEGTFVCVTADFEMIEGGSLTVMFVGLDYDAKSMFDNIGNAGVLTFLVVKEIEVLANAKAIIIFGKSFREFDFEATGLVYVGRTWCRSEREIQGDFQQIFS